MQLFIVRHGEAEARAETDAQRPLSVRGRKQVDALWRQLQGEGVRVQRIMASPYLRAQQTAALIARHYPEVTPGTLQLITPDDRPQGVLAWLAQQDSLEGLVLVSHMPLVALLSGLLTEGEGARVAFGVGDVACFDLEYPASASARLIWQRHPADI